MNPHLFPSFFLGGFESSTQRRYDGRQLDLVASTQHDVFARQDYEALSRHRLFAARDAARWHLIEAQKGQYNWESFQRQVEAARETDTTIIWDVCHYGWPHWLDIWSEEFVESCANFAREMALFVAANTDQPHFFAPFNEPSFFAYAGGAKGFFAPYAHDRGVELKRQVVRAIIAASRAIREVLPVARLVHTDPLIYVRAHPERPHEAFGARIDNEAQWEVWDAVAGRYWEDLGGAPDLLDVIGVNYYVHNQWFFPGGHDTLIEPSHPLHRRLRFLLQDVSQRYNRPLFIAETGIEGHKRPEWLAYISAEVRAAMALGVPVEGVCFYPICDYPGWDDDRHCPTGLFGYADHNGQREVFEPLAAELECQQFKMREFLDADQRGREAIVELEREPERVFDRVAHLMEERSEH